jgi:hypothetical protein
MLTGKYCNLNISNIIGKYLLPNKMYIKYKYNSCLNELLDNTELIKYYLRFESTR